MVKGNKFMKVGCSQIVGLECEIKVLNHIL